MASLKEIKNRISSVKKTLKITSAMRMVASAKLHKAQAAIENMVPYRDKMNRILSRFLDGNLHDIQSLYTANRPVKRVALVAFSSNTSLCGAFNANVVKQLLHTAGEYASTIGPENVLVYPVGRKVEEEARKHGCNVMGSYQEMAGKPSYDSAVQFASELMLLFSTGRVDKVEFIYHHFKSVGSQQLLRETYLPLNLTAEGKPNGGDAASSSFRTDYIVEPSVQEFISGLLPQVLQLNVYTALLDSDASEHAARTMSMQLATDNANELIDDLSKQYNRLRQQAITNELLDIVGGTMR